MSVRPSKKTVQLVIDRDWGLCAWCGEPVRGERGEDFSVHHRRAAGMGGDPRPETHAPPNLVLLCGSGTTRCHGDVESDRLSARAAGFLIPKLSTTPPSQWQIKHKAHGWVYLLDDGSWEAA